MTHPVQINQLSPEAALEQAIKASELLLEVLEKLETNDPSRADKLASIRDQLIHQVFSVDWSKDLVNTHLESLRRLEQLDQQLLEQANLVRNSLHRQRAENQHNKKAVTAYGTARTQFQR